MEATTIEAGFYNTDKLPVRHISAFAKETYELIQRRQQGEESSLDTGFTSLNKALLGGLEWNRILTLAGISGGGKSITVELLKKNFVELNPTQKFDILSFSFEMPAVDDISRLISNKLSIEREELYSAYTPIAEERLEEVGGLLKELENNRVYISEIPGSPIQIYDTIMDFILTRNLIENDTGLIVTLDHSLLVSGKTDKEKAIVDELYKMFVQLKKEIISMGGKIIIIPLSQLNREIENEKRVINPKLHYPQKGDLFAASSAYYCSDYVIVVHKPSLVNGIGYNYGPPIGIKYPKGLPVFNPRNPDESMVYFHIIKNRFGQANTILMMIDQYVFSRVIPYVE